MNMPDRRAFARGTAAAGASVALGAAGLKAAGAAEPSAAWDYEADVLAIGGGAADLVTAASARVSGASAILVEKASSLGGDSLLCGACIYAWYPDKMDETLDEFFTGTCIPECANDPSMDPASAPGTYREFVELAAANEWLRDNAGIDWERDPFWGGAWGTDLDYFWKLADTVEAMDDVMILTDTAAYELVVEDGRVVGARCEDGSYGTVAIRARKGVVICTGSFDGDPSMLYRYYGRGMASAGTAGCLTKNGDGHKMAAHVGAELSAMDSGVHCMAYNPGSVSLAVANMVSALRPLPGIMVNLDGKRFMREEGSYSYYGNTIVNQRGNVGYYLLTQDRRPEPGHRRGVALRPPRRRAGAEGPGWRAGGWRAGG